MPKEQSDYRSYLVRLWREGNTGSSYWRASLECSLTGQRHLFASLEALSATLQRRTAGGCVQGQDEDATGQEPPPT